jgi:hypothetical protein
LTYDALVAVLHVDAEDFEQFEFPNGDDVAMEYNGRIIYVPYDLLTPEE